MASYPKDRFDDLPEDLVRVGAHRAPRKKGGGWIGFAWAALATLVLTVGGLFVLSVIDPGVRFEIPGLPVAEQTSAAPEDESTPTAIPLTHRRRAGYRGPGARGGRLASRQPGHRLDERHREDHRLLQQPRRRGDRPRARAGARRR
jgi:hypothetical protein